MSCSFNMFSLSYFDVMLRKLAPTIEVSLRKPSRLLLSLEVCSFSSASCDWLFCVLVLSADSSFSQLLSLDFDSSSKRAGTQEARTARQKITNKKGDLVMP